MHFFSLLCTSVSSRMRKYAGARACHLLWKWMAYVSIPMDVYISFFIDACLYDSSVTGPSVHTLHDSVCLSAPLKWSCLVRQTVKGWGRGLSRNAALCIVCKNKPSGQRYLNRIYIKQLQKQASVCVDRWCKRTTPQVWMWSSSRTRIIKKSEMRSFDWALHWCLSHEEIWRVCLSGRKNRRVFEYGKGSSSSQVKVRRHRSAVGQTWVHRKALSSKAETLTQLLAHHKEQMWRAKKPAACNRPSGQAKYCLSAPPFYLPLAHLYCPWSHIGTLQSLSAGRGIYGGAIRVISSTGKQWPTLVVFDSVRSTAGVNGTQQNSTPTTQWCLSLSAKVTSNKHCKQRGLLNADTESKGWCLHRGTTTLHPFQNASCPVLPTFLDTTTTSEVKLSWVVGPAESYKRKIIATCCIRLETSIIKHRG